MPSSGGPPADWLVPDWNAPQAGALMTTRRGGVSRAPFDSMNVRDGLGDDPAHTAANRERLAEAIGALPVYLEQVHGTRVALLHDASPVAEPADGAVATRPGIACMIQVADCLPVLFAAPRGVAAAHAGWRGLAGGVIEATLATLCAQSGCEAAEVQAWLGPCIGPRRFEVGADVLQAFGASTDQADPLRFRPHAPGKWLANLPQLARDRLQRAGVERVTAADACTVEDASRFFSFRRDGRTGRMVAAVWLRG